MELMKRILVADASEDFRRGLLSGLENEPDLRAVGQTGDGCELLELAKTLEPDAIVMDLVLTGADGLDVLKGLSQLPRRPKVLLVSGYTQGNIVSEAAARGADYYLTKPCRCSTVCERVRALLSDSAGEIEEDQKTALETRITAIIHEVGVPAHIKGYQYLREAIRLTVEDMEMINAVTKLLYPEVAKTFRPRPAGWSGPSATLLRWRGIGATWTRCKNISASPSPTPRENPPTASLSP